jgi:Leucine-rich repeat (LRR) protein
VELDLRNNQLIELPAALGNARRLSYLDLRGNKLRALPASLAALPNLEKLDLRWNKLMGEHPWLHDLERRGCRVLR